MDIATDPNSESEETGMTSLQYAIKRSLLSRNKLAIIMNNPDGFVQFCCVECTYKCDDKEVLEKHLLAHNKEYRYLCGICGTGLKRKEHLDRHTLEHQEVRPHVCPDCGKAFKRKEHMNIHRSIHSGDKTEQCPICNKSFYRKDHLRKHLQTHSKVFMENNLHPLYDQVMVDIKQEMMDEDVKPTIDDMQEDDMALVQEDDMALVQEDEMSLAQEDEEYYNEEMTEIHDEDSNPEPYNSGLSNEPVNVERPFTCHLCHKSYKRRDHLKIHSWTHIKKDKVCSECGKAYHKEEQLLSHMNVHLQVYQPGMSLEVSQLGVSADHQDGGDAFGPDNSLRVSRTVSAVKQKAESRPHECAVCQRRFKRKQHLKQHLNVHFKPHQPSVWCSICGEGFLSNLKFQSHQCTPSSPDNNSENFEGQGVLIKPMEAKKENEYPQEYVDVSELPSLAGAHIEPPLPVPMRVFVCKFCTKPFKRKDHYKIHLNIHTGIKTFFCPTCGKGFYRKDHMQKHTQVHNKEKERPRREVPDLFPINTTPTTKEIKPEITIRAPSSTKLRVPLQIKVPYQMVVSMGNGEQRAVTVDPQAEDETIIS